MRGRHAVWTAGAVIGVGLLAVVLAGCARHPADDSARAPGQETKPEYLRIGVSPETTVYVEFLGGKMRMATTVDGLKAAKPVKASKSSTARIGSQGATTRYTFPTVDLPVSADKLPGKWSKATAQLTLEWFSSEATKRVGQATYAHGELGLRRKDARGALWTYVLGLSSSTSATPQQASLAELPQSDKLALSIIAEANEDDRLGIGLTLEVGNSEISDIRRNRRSTDAKVTLRDAGGKVVAAANGPLDKFGFG